MNDVPDPGVSAPVPTPLSADQLGGDRVQESLMEGRFKDLAESLPGMVYEVSTDQKMNVRYTYVSQRAHDITGLTPEQLLADPMALAKITLPQDFPVLARAYAEGAMKMSPVTVDVRLRRPDTGAIRWMRTFASPRRTEHGGWLWNNYALDVTSEKDAQERLETAERQLRTIADTVPGALYQFRVDKAGDVTMTYLSDGILRLTGIDQETSQRDPRARFETLMPEDVSVTSAAIREATANLTMLSTDFRIRHAKSGEIRWMRSLGLPQREPDGSTIFNGFWQDITDTRKLENDLAAARDAAQAAEGRVREITDRSPGVLFELRRTPDGALGFPFISNRLEELCGVPAEEGRVNPMAVMERVVQEDLPVVMGQMASPTEGNVDFEYRIIHRDGRLRWLRTAALKRFEADGTMAATGFWQDNTEKHELQESLARATEMAQAANHAKSEFLANISHEIRTPMNAVLSFAYLGLRSEQPQRQRDYFAKIESAARSLLDIINDVLDLSKVEAGRLELDDAPFALSQVLDNLESVVGLRAQEKALAFRIEVEPTVPRNLVGDPLRLGQILLNLGGNAVKFTERGEVVVRVSAAPVSAGDERVQLHFAVQDSGVGLSAEQIAKLFAPFVQADSSTTRKFGGTGLGLSICKRMVKLMGGSIGVDSEPGRGSTFRFDVSLGISSQDAAPRVVAVRQEADLTGLCALVVDDHEANLEVARDLLQSAGVIVSLAASGAEGIALAAQQTFDAIFMDMRMPGMDGIEATGHIRAAESGRRVPIIALTANVMAPDRERCLSAGMDDFVGKPIDVDELFAALSRVTGRGEGPVLHRRDRREDAEPDFDFERARGRVARTPALYERLALHFIDGEDLAERIRVQTQAGQLAEAAISAHTLKGFGAQIGALRLSRLAAKLEARLGAAGASAPHEDELDELDAAMTAARHELRAAMASTTTTQPVDAERVKQLSAKLEQELEDDEDSAWDTFEALAAALPAQRREAVAAVGRHIANLEYEQALDLWRSLRG
ncbi:PAS domain S-box-containing protein [Panacagrimonas perspica]|uniref:histidine kinase n=1 Tax=Panacagrimonas perspica TaxID=381431 RepID=A0A4R7P493_9GAMM|nr:PAS domain-containing protein [Panacagrimonas perspica]TDU28209.1 PAS domain S-box-containing protein [Panacagrimonas perspica]